MLDKLRIRARLTRLWATIGSVVVPVVIFAYFAVPGAVLRPMLRDRLRAHPSEALWWGALPVILAGVAWLAYMVVYRAGVTVVRRGPLPFTKKSRTALAAFWTALGFTALAGVSFQSVYVFSRYSSARRHSLHHEFPALVDGTVRALPTVIGILLLLWIVFVVARPWFRYVGHRLAPTRVDGIRDLGGTNSVRVLYRPSIGLGAPMRVRINGGSPFKVSAGQSLGLRAPAGRLGLTFQGRNTPAEDVIHVDLTLRDGEGTLLIVNDGAMRRVVPRAVAEAREYVQVDRPYASRWADLGSSGWAMFASDPSRVRHQEGLHRLRRRERAQGVIALVLGGVLGLLFAHLVAGRGVAEGRWPLVLGDVVLGTALLYGALWFHRRKQKLWLRVWERPADLALAFFGGATLYFAGAILAVVCALLALVIHNPAVIRSRMEFPRVPSLSEVVESWHEEPDAVLRWLSGSASRWGSRTGGLRVSAAHPLKGVSVGLEGEELVPLGVSPLGARLRAGAVRLVVTGLHCEQVVDVEIVAGASVDVKVGVMPIGLQWRSLRGALSVDVSAPQQGRLRKVSAPGVN